jgi:NADPH:quinone reductase
MRAAQLTRLDGPDAVEVGEIDEPSGDGVVVDVHAAGAAFPDALLTRGLYQYKPDPPSDRRPTMPLCVPATGLSA